MLDRWRLRTSFIMAFVAMGPAGLAWADLAAQQRGIEALRAGNNALAVKALTAALSDTGATKEARARTLYLRAKAHLGLQQNGQAMADAGAALWFNTLAPTDKAEAEQIRAKALAGAGGGTGAAGARPVVLNSGADTLGVPVGRPAAAGAMTATTPTPTPTQAPAAAPTWPAAAVRHEARPTVGTAKEVTVSAGPPAAPAQVAPLAAPWTAAAVRSEALPQVIEDRAPSTVIQAAATPRVQPVAAVAPVETGAIVLPAGEAGSKAESSVPVPANAVGSAMGLLPDFKEIGRIFSAPPSPHQAEIERANARQDRYAEKVRQHNRQAANRSGEPAADRVGDGPDR